MPGTAESSSVADLADLAHLGKEWEEHSPKLLAMIRWKIHFPLMNGEEAHDILHKVFVVAHRRWPTCSRERRALPYVWLYGLARDQVIETFRTIGRRQSEPWPDESGLVPPDNHTGPQTKAMREE